MVENGGLPATGGVAPLNKTSGREREGVRWGGGGGEEAERQAEKRDRKTDEAKVTATGTNKTGPGPVCTTR